MNLDEIKKIIADHKKDFNHYNIKAFFVFGSASRGQMTPESDIDLLVEFNDDQVDLFAFIDLKLKLEEVLNRKVDLVTKRALHPKLRDDILKEAIRVA